MIQYYLMAEQLVPERHVDDFDNNVAEFLKLGGFERLMPSFDNQLTLALKSQEPFPYTTYSTSAAKGPLRKYRQDPRLKKTDRVHQYVHLWRVLEAADMAMAEVMVRCADDDLYTAISSSVVREIQNFVVAVRWLALKNVDIIASAKRPVCAITRRFQPADLGRYLSVVGVMLPAMQHEGWTLVGYYQNVTGPLNTVTELWQSDGKVKRSATDTLNELLNRLPPHVRKFQQVVYETSLLFDLAPYDSRWAKKRT